MKTNLLGAFLTLAIAVPFITTVLKVVIPMNLDGTAIFIAGFLCAFITMCIYTYCLLLAGRITGKHSSLFNFTNT